MPERRRRNRDGGSSLAGLIPQTAYHGAHRPPLDGLMPRSEVRDIPRLTAFTHDLLTDGPLPTAYTSCDVLVSDLPWRLGFDTFNERAGITDDRTYDEFLDVIGALTDRLDIPVYLITGRHALPKLPPPATTLPMMLNEDDAVAVCYRPGDEADGRYGTAPEFLHALAQRYTTAGDPCCGYGRTARVFLRNNRAAVVSDMNPQCIGYIAGHAHEWTPQ